MKVEYHNIIRQKRENDIYDIWSVVFGYHFIYHEKTIEAIQSSI